MCHACLLGDRKYKHELPDSTTFVVKSKDLIHGRYNWDPEYLEVSNNPEKYAGIIMSEEDIKEREQYGHMGDIIKENFPYTLI